jgi:uncharacterized protein
MRLPHWHWAALVALSALFVGVLEAAHLPAALLLGGMAAAIVMASSDVAMKVPRWPLMAAQGVIALLIARTITPSLLGTMLGGWPLFLSVIVAVIVVSALLGWLLARLRILPGTVAVWGSSPGAATAMTLMAGEYGADMRLVAFMQYLRVVFVALLASVVARIWTAHGSHRAAIDWWPAVPWQPFLATVALAVCGAYAGRRLRIPAGTLLFPMILGAILHGSGRMEIVLPPWLLAASYMLVGWNIGLGFTRPILRHAAKAFPRVTLAILVQIGVCGGLAAILHRWAGIDALSAYLATSPGGVDSAAIIAASAKVDLPFVMAMQTTRLMLVLLISPALARFISRRLMAAAPDSPATASSAQ